jgi:hypothetical protein
MHFSVLWFVYFLCSLMLDHILIFFCLIHLLACQMGHDDAVRYLILKGMDPEDMDESGRKCSGAVYDRK